MISLDFSKDAARCILILIFFFFAATWDHTRRVASPMRDASLLHLHLDDRTRSSRWISHIGRTIAGNLSQSRQCSRIASANRRIALAILWEEQGSRSCGENSGFFGQQSRVRARMVFFLIQSPYVDVCGVNVLIVLCIQSRYFIGKEGWVSGTSGCVYAKWSDWVRSVSRNLLTRIGR